MKEEERKMKQIAKVGLGLKKNTVNQLLKSNNKEEYLQKLIEQVYWLGYCDKEEEFKNIL